MSVPIEMTQGRQSCENVFHTLEPIFKELLNSITIMNQIEFARVD